jgi:hypothetical protein
MPGRQRAPSADRAAAAGAAWLRVLTPAGHEGCVDQHYVTPVDRYNSHMALFEQMHFVIIEHIEAENVLSIAQARLAETRSSAGE